MDEHTTAEFYEGDVILIKLAPAPTPSDLAVNFLAPLNAKLDMKKHFSVIVDSSNVATANAALVKTIVSWLRSNRERFKLYLRCSSIIVTGTLVRNILDLVFKVQTPVAPMKVVSDLHAAWEHVALIEKKQD